MSVLVKISAKAPTATMHADVALLFETLRERVRKGSGVDFLAVCGDVSRPAGFVSTKDGVANRSWHKTGRAFDYDQTSKSLVIVSEPKNGKQFFRTYLVCADQNGLQGIKLTLKDYRGHTKTAFVYDFTAAAEKLGFMRIAAWSGWQKNYNRREFWHYEKRDGLTWDEAMLQLKNKVRLVEDRVLGLSDRGANVEVVQRALHALGFLPKHEIDGIFGAKTKTAVIAFQKKNGLDVDGLVGKDTRKKLGL